MPRWPEKPARYNVFDRPTKDTHPVLITWIVLGAFLLSGTIVPVHAGGRTLTVYAGRVTKDRWFESLPPVVRYVDAYILVGAMAWTIRDYRDGDITLEVEGQAAKYHGDQEHFEFNLPFALRFHEFPWDGSVDTSFAFGLGPSWATKEPEVEIENLGSTQKFLVHWFGEIALGPPGAGWAAVLRLHHRSKAFGLVAEKGGSNTLAAGLKFRF